MKNLRQGLLSVNKTNSACSQVSPATPDGRCINEVLYTQPNVAGGGASSEWPDFYGADPKSGPVSLDAVNVRGGQSITTIDAARTLASPVKGHGYAGGAWGAGKPFTVGPNATYMGPNLGPPFRSYLGFYGKAQRLVKIL